MNSFGIMNNRFHQKVIENRQRAKSLNHLNRHDIIYEKYGKKRNEYYENWLQQQQTKTQEIHSDSNIETFTPQTPKVQTVQQLEPKLLDHLNEKSKFSKKS